MYLGKGGYNRYRVRLLLLALLAALVLPAAPAGRAEPAASGVLSGISWTLSSDGVLTLSGRGAVPAAEFRTAENAPGEAWYESPWHAHRDSIRSLTLEEGITSVGDRAFDGCLYLESVSFPSTLRSVGYAAFRRTGLTALTLPDAVTDIGGHAFAGCWKLETADLGGSAARVGAFAFYQDEALTAVSLPASLRRVGENAFSGCGRVERVVFRKASRAAEWAGIVFENAEANPLAGGQAYLYDGEELVTRLTLSKDDGPVGDYAFYRCQNDLNVEAQGDYAGSVGKYAFFGCEGLREARFSANTAGVGEYAFAGCRQLTDTGDLLTGLSRLMDGAFSGCVSLPFVHLGGGLREIGPDVFSGCLSLSSVTADEGLPRITDRMFSGCALLSEIIIPSGVSSIGEYAFRDCVSLKKAVIPATAGQVGAGAFQGCASLTDVRFLGMAPVIGAGAFGLVRADVTCFEGKSWEGRQNNYGGFLNWKSVSGVSADGRLFWAIDDRRRLVFSGSGAVVSTGTWYEYRGQFREIVLEKGVGGISLNFISAYLPEDGWITFHAGVSDPVGTGQAGASPERLAGRYGFTVYEDWAEDACWSLDRDGTLTVGGSGPVPGFGGNAPWNAVRDHIRALTIAPGVTAIGNGAFENASFGEALSLPDTVSAIGDNAFAGCAQLRWAVLPQSVREIGAGAFPEGLEAVYAPAGSYAARWAGENGFFTFDSDSPARLVAALETAELSTEDALDLSECFRVEPVFRSAEHQITYSVSGGAGLDGTKLIPSGEGSAVVRAFLDGQETGAALTVVIRRPIVSVSLPREAVVAAGESIPLSGLAWEPADADALIRWSFSDPQALRTEEDRLFAAPGTDGQFTVTARAWNGVSAQMNVRVYVPQVKSIVFHPVADVYPVGAELPLVCDVTDQLRSYQNERIVFSSSRPDVAAVEPDGLVTFLQSGTSVITASAGSGVSESLTLTAAVPAERFIITCPDVVAVGQAPVQAGLAGVEPENADLSVNWSVSDSRIAALEGNMLRPFRAGEVTLRAVNWDGTSAEKTVRVFGRVTEVSIAPVPETLSLGTKLKLEVSALSGGTPADGRLLTFVSSDENVAAVDADGLVTLKAGGDAVITASAGTAEASVTVRARREVESFSLPENLIVMQYHAYELPVSDLVPEDAWQSFVSSADEPEVLLVDEEGILIGRRPGETYLNVSSWNGVNRSVRVAVLPFEAENVLTVPSGTGIVRSHSFSGAPAEAVRVSAGCTEIGEYAFADCRELVCVFLPDTVRSIADTALSGCDALVCVVAPKGSYAEQWAKRRGILVFAE